MRPRASSREQRTLLLIAALSLVIVWIYAVLIIQPLMREAGRVGERVRAAREQLKVLELGTVHEAALREEHRRLQETVGSLRHRLPTEEELPRVIERLSDLAARSQVKIQTIFPQRPLEGAGTPAALPARPSPAPVFFKDALIQVDAMAGYHQLGTFLSLVETDERPMQVSSLQISSERGESKRFRIRLVVQSYFATSDAVASGGGAL